MKCRLCWREASNGFCPYHLKAKARVESSYELWVRAYGSLDWKTYLGKVIANPETGQWSKEIAQFLEGISNDKRET
jgi:hypothetical protein